MRRLSLLLAALLPASLAAGADAPIGWDSEGRWFAYVATGPSHRAIPPSGWVLTGAPKAAPEGAPKPTPRNLSYRIYVSDAVAGTSLLIYESRSPLSSPTWSPDGHQLAFGRIVTLPAGESRYEVLIQAGLQERRTVFSRPMEAQDEIIQGFPSRTMAWSPDGRYLAVPDASARNGLLIIRADTGSVLKAVNAASWPSWSPDSSRLAVLIEDRTTTLAITGLSTNGPRKLTEVLRSGQSPCWSRDGRSLLAISSQVSPRGVRGIVQQQASVVRVQADSGTSEIVAPLQSNPFDRTTAVQGICLTADRDAEELFSSVDMSKPPASVTWFRPRTGETVSLFHPIDEISVRVASLALAPNSRALAVRLGAGDCPGTIAVWDPSPPPNRKPAHLLDPDESTRFEWVSLLVNTAHELLAVCLPPATVDGKVARRPTLLPVRGELPPAQELVLRFRRIGKNGRDLCDRPSGSEGVDPELDGFFAEARVFFDVLRDDYKSALASLDALEARTTSSDELARLLALRAQIYVGLEDRERAKDTIAYLKRLERTLPTRWEETVEGVKLTPVAPAEHGWPGYLEARLEARVKPAPRAAVPLRGVAPNIENGQFGPGMMLLPQPPFQPMPPAPPPPPRLIFPGRVEPPDVNPAGNDEDVRIEFRPKGRFQPDPPLPR